MIRCYKWLTFHLCLIEIRYLLLCTEWIPDKAIFFSTLYIFGRSVVIICRIIFIPHRDPWKGTNIKFNLLFLYLNCSTNSRNLSLLWRHGFELCTKYREYRESRGVSRSAQGSFCSVESGPDVTHQQNSSLCPVAIALWSCSGLFRRNRFFSLQQVDRC